MKTSSGAGGGAGGGASVTLTPWSDDEESTSSSSQATLMGTTVTAKLVRVPRSHGFHAACDEVSSDLQHVGVIMCTRTGMPRPAIVKAAEGMHAGENDFLYIADFYDGGLSVQDAAAALRAIIQQVGEGNWGLLAYIPSQPEATASHPPHDATPAALEKYRVTVSEIINAYSRVSITAGFTQVTPVTTSFPLYFAVPAFLDSPQLSQDAASAIPISALPVLPKMSAIDTALFQLVNNASGDSDVTTVSVEVAKLMARGATLEKARVLHATAFHNNVPLLKKLMEMVPVAQRTNFIHERDDYGFTPLMLAAKGAPGKSSIHANAPTEMCLFLIGLGADKSAVNADGRTAYGEMKAAERNLSDFYNSFQIKHGNPCAGLEICLMPAGGATAADLFASLEGDDEDEDEDFDGDEDFDDDD